MSTPTPSFRFRPHEHLRRAADFRRVYDRRRSVSNDWLIVYACENDLPHLRLRRLYREAFRLTRHQMPVGMDLILIPRRPEPPALEELKEALPRLVRQAARKLGREA